MTAPNGNKNEKRIVKFNRTEQTQPDGVTKTPYQNENQIHRNLDQRSLFPVRIPFLVDPDLDPQTQTNPDPKTIQIRVWI